MLPLHRVVFLLIKQVNAVAADVSLTYKNVKANQEGWTFGFVLSNLGSKIGYTNDATQKEFIPANMGLGGNYTKVFDEQNKISFGLGPEQTAGTSSSGTRQWGRYGKYRKLCRNIIVKVWLAAGSSLLMASGIQ